MTELTEGTYHTVCKRVLKLKQIYGFVAPSQGLEMRKIDLFLIIKKESLEGAICLNTVRWISRLSLVIFFTDKHPPAINEGSNPYTSSTFIGLLMLN